MELGTQKYGIAGLEKKSFLLLLKKALSLRGFISRTAVSFAKEFTETIAMIQVQTSCYDSVDYYVNVACVVKALSNNADAPLFDRDRCNFVRLDDKGSMEACLADIDYYVNGFSSIEKLRNFTLQHRNLYNMSSAKLLEYLNI